MKTKFLSTGEAVNFIKDGDKIGTVGFLLTGAPEEIFLKLEERFKETRSPKDLTLMWASGVGAGGVGDRGLNRLAQEGLLKRTIGGHYGLIPKLAPLILQEKIEAYNFPQGVLTSMFREMSAKKPGVLTHVGLGTFVDPDFGGGKLNKITTEDIVSKIRVNGLNYLLYKSQEINVAIIRGTEADEDGNIGISKEALKLENLSVATAAKNNGGIVICQVEKVVPRGTLDPKTISVPGALVDIVAVAEDEKNHMQTAGTQFNPDFIKNNGLNADDEVCECDLDVKMVIGRRAAMELKQGMRILNFGIGIPEKVAEALKESKLEDQFVTTLEPGVYGGTAQGGLNFGSAIGPQAIIDHPYQFDFYDGGGIDMTFLGMAQCDSAGSLNVSKFSSKIPGCGGFIDISQNSKNCIFCGTFTAGECTIEVGNGKLNIVKDGDVKKFIQTLEHITFNGAYESQKQKNIKIITERAVFQYTTNGIELIEIAPGTDLEKDILNKMEFVPLVSKDIKVMDESIFGLGEFQLTL